MEANNLVDFINQLMDDEYYESEPLLKFRYFQLGADDRHILFGRVLSENEKELFLWVVNGGYVLKHNKINHNNEFIDDVHNLVRNTSTEKLIEITDEVLALGFNKK